MMDRPISKLAVLTLSLLCAACAITSEGTVESRKADSYTTQPSKLLIMGAFAGTMKTPNTLFTTSHDESDIMGAQMVNTLSKCGITAKYHAIDPLAVDDSQQTLVNEFGPDAILKISAISETTGNYIHLIKYHLELTDTKTKTVPWKAQVDLNQRREAGRIMANTILGRMQKDGLIPASCQVTTE